MYCYIPMKDKWAVGHYDPNDREFIVEGLYDTVGAAAARVHYLNGGN